LGTIRISVVPVLAFVFHNEFVWKNLSTLSQKSVEERAGTMDNAHIPPCQCVNSPLVLLIVEKLQDSLIEIL